MRKRKVWELVLAATLAAPLLAAAQLSSIVLRDDGIESPDGSLQTTVAGSYVPAWEGMRATACSTPTARC